MLPDLAFLSGGQQRLQRDQLQKSRAWTKSWKTYRREFDEPKRIQLYKEFQEILNDEQPYTFLYVSKRVSALQRRFEGVEVFPDGLRPSTGGCRWRGKDTPSVASAQ